MTSSTARRQAAALADRPAAGNSAASRPSSRPSASTAGGTCGHGSRQAVLLVNADPNLIPQRQLQQVYHVLDTAYCRGAPS